MVGRRGRRISRDTSHVAWRISHAADKSLRSPDRGTLWAAGGSGRRLVVFTLHRPEYLSLGTAQPGSATAGSPDPAAHVDCGDADHADGTREVVSASPLRARYP